MYKGFESGSDINPDMGSDAGGDTNSDFGGDLAGNAGVDLNAADSMNNSHTEQFRGAVGDLVRGSAQWAGENPVQAHDNPYAYGTRMAFGLREALGQAVYHGSAAFMETLPPEYKPPAMTSYQDENGEIKWDYLPKP